MKAERSCAERAALKAETEATKSWRDQDIGAFVRREYVRSMGLIGTSSQTSTSTS
ncbi:MAG: hypothetical protein U1F43_26255 [Myxococcota bacterium]